MSDRRHGPLSLNSASTKNAKYLSLLCAGCGIANNRNGAAIVAFASLPTEVRTLAALRTHLLLPRKASRPCGEGGDGCGYGGVIRREEEVDTGFEAG